MTTSVMEPTTSASYLYDPENPGRVAGVIVFGGTAKAAREHATAVAGQRGMVLTGPARRGRWEPGGRAYRWYPAAAV
jgi:hypothetical protein